MSKRKKKELQELNQIKEFSLKKVTPLTDNQAIAFNEFFDNDMDLILSGFAGTGKTYLALYMALNSVFTKMKYKKVVIFRSAVATREVGFLPGSLAEKMQVYEAPYRGIVDNLFGRGDGYDILKLKGLVSFESTSFLRGTTYEDCVIVVDEFNNMNYSELKTIITRAGNNTKFIFSGDYTQSDLKKIEKQGILDFLSIIGSMDCFAKIEFGMNDIVRSEKVKEFLIKEYEFEIAKL